MPTQRAPLEGRWSFDAKGRGAGETSSGEEIALLAATLPRLHDAALQLIQGRKTSPVGVCVELARSVGLVDLTSEAGQDFRRRFNGFYGVRRNAAWREAFYSVFESLKAETASADILFDRMLAAVFDRTGWTEASFVSKAVAVLRPEGPIIDSVVRARLAERISTPPFGGGLENASAYYRWLLGVFEGIGRTKEAAAWSTDFEKAFADVPGAASLHIHRKLDFLIWGGRSVD
jgi:hypothetical protein